MAEYILQYGNRTLKADIPGARLLNAPSAVTPGDPGLLVRRALDAPIGTPRLRELVRPGERVVIVTSDITRYTGSDVYLPILADELRAAGVVDHQISVVIGLGIHRGQSVEEQRKILGPLYGRVEVFDHACDEPGQLVDLGETETGLPVQINRRVMEADRVIVTGTVGFHYFAGFGGGRKGLVPGVASRKTCMATHFKVFNPPEIGGKHPRAVTAQLEGNPVHEAILQAARKVKPAFLLNTVVSPEKELLAVFCGDMEQAHLAGCDFVRSLYSVPLEKPCELAIVSCGGQPKDINFIQAHKALAYGVNALREGGTIILLAACPDGFGNPTFFDWFRHQDLGEFEAALRQGYEINGQTAHSTLDKARRFRVILVSEFDAAQTAAMGMEKAETLDAALQMAYERLPAQPDTVVIPNGGTILPVLQS